MSNPRIPRKPGQPANSKKHSDLYTDENPKGTIHGLGFKDVATAKASVSKIRNSSRSHAHKIQAAVAMEQRAREMGKSSEAAVYRKFINSMKKKTKEMNEEKKNGRCPAGQYYCYTDEKCKPIPKGYKMVGRAGYLRKENGHSIDDKKNGGSNGNGNGNGGNGNGSGNGGSSNGNGGGVSESKSGDSSLRDWFSKSRSSDGKPGWVQLGGKYAGKPCAKQPGQTTKPKCGSSKMKRNLNKKEEDAAFRRKNAKDPNPNRSGKAINVKTEEFTTLPLNIEIPNNIRDFNLGLMFRESLDINSGMLFIFDEVDQQSFYMKETKIPLDIAFITEDGIVESIKQLEPYDETPVTSEGEVLCALEVNRGWFAENNVEIGDEIEIDEAAGEKDACYHKVKSRYKVWPSAYASGALVKCRKKGAANWGNSTKKEEFSNWRDNYTPTDYETVDVITPEPLEATKGIGSEMLDEKHDTPKNVKGIAKELDKAVEMHKSQAKRLRKAGISEDNLDEKCWKGYEKKGMKTMFGKRYPNCVKKEEDELKLVSKTPLDEKKGCMHNHKGEECPVHGIKECPGPIKEAVRMPAKTGNLVNVIFRFRSQSVMLKMFFPQVSLPNRSDIQDQIDKVYPGAKLLTYTVSDYEPGQPVLHAEAAAWTRKAGKNKEGGLNEKGRKSYERENPGSDLKAPSKKVGNPRRASFCARMKGMKKKLTSSKTANDPDSRINKSLRKWNC
jgi:uncharacterized membrane protein (UPF0127 family)